MGEGKVRALEAFLSVGVILPVGREVVLERFPRDLESCGAPWAGNDEVGVAFEDAIESVAVIGQEEVVDAFDPAAAVEMVEPAFEQAEFLVLIEGLDGGVVERVEPVEVALRLGCDEDEFVRSGAEVSGRALLAASVVESPHR